MADKHTGTIDLLRQGFGFVKSDKGKLRLFFSAAELALSHNWKVGDKASFTLGTNSEGPCAKELEPLASDEASNESHSNEPDYLAQAVISRDNRQFEQAARLYRKAMDVAPTLQTVLGFAAMEKNRGRKKEAMEIYLEGLKRVPSKVPPRKIYEDAATLAITLKRHSEARKLLTEALKTAKPGTQGAIYLLLARNAYRENQIPTLKECINYYEQALTALPAASVPHNDRLSYNIARIRIQHHRGNLAFNFFNNECFKILEAELLDVTTHGADLIVNIVGNELTESFGIGPKILVRVFFKATVHLSDIEELASKIQSTATEQGTDDQFCLMVTASTSDELKKVLFARIENKNKLYPAIVPLSQELIETESPQSALNDVFGQWLYRRDLFSVNFPVVGRRFFGRNRDLDELRDSISDSIPVGLFGLRKVGKTSLIKELARRAGDSGDFYVYIDLLRIPADVTDFKWIYWRLASELHQLASSTFKLAPFDWRLGGKFNSILDIPENFPVATAFDADLTSLLNTIQNTSTLPRPKVVFLLDEIERLLPNSQGKEGLAGYFDFFSYLRGVCQESTDFSLVVTGANAAISEIAQFEGRDNPAFNFLKPIYLKLLSPQDCNAMLTVLARGMGIKFAKGAIPQIVTLTGGHPFFSRQLCSFIAEQYKERPLEITEETINSIIPQYIPFCDKDMREIFDRLGRDYPTELELCISLAKNFETPQISLSNTQVDISATSLRHLIGYQLIEPSGATLQFTMELLRVWLNNKIGTSHE